MLITNRFPVPFFIKIFIKERFIRSQTETIQGETKTLKPLRMNSCTEKSCPCVKEGFIYSSLQQEKKANITHWTPQISTISLYGAVENVPLFQATVYGVS